MYTYSWCTLLYNRNQNYKAIVFQLEKKSVPTGDDGCLLNLLQQSLLDVCNIILYTLNLYSAVCQVYLNKTRIKKKDKEHRHREYSLFFLGHCSY